MSLLYLQVLKDKSIKFRQENKGRRVRFIEQ